MERPLDLHEHLVRHKSATFFLCASGQSMINAGIFDGDLLIVDRIGHICNSQAVADTEAFDTHAHNQDALLAYSLM